MICTLADRFELDRAAAPKVVTCSARPNPAATIREVSLSTAVRRLKLAVARAAIPRSSNEVRLGGRATWSSGFEALTFCMPCINAA